MNAQMSNTEAATFTGLAGRAAPTEVLRTLPQIITKHSKEHVSKAYRDAWPLEREEAFQEIVKQYGEPYHGCPDRNGQLNNVVPNERHFAARVVNEGQVIHDPAEGFYQYYPASGLWRAVSDHVMAQYAAAVVREQAEYDACHALEKKIKDSLQRAIVNQARGIGEQLEFFPDWPEAIHVANGMFKVSSEGLEFLEGGFSPDFRSRSRCEIPYYPDAKCPRTEGELVRFNLSEDDANVYWRYLGLCLLKRNITRRILIIHSASSGTSKSPLTMLASGLVGNSIELRTKHLEGRFETHRLVEKSLLIGPDVAGNFLDTEGAQSLLRLTGGDLITTEAKNDKGKRSRSMKGRYCVMISSNNHLRVSEGTIIDPWRKRLIILESLGNIPKREIPDFADVLLREEGPGILNRAIAGLRDLLKDSRSGDPFGLTEHQKKRVETLLSSSNTGQKFVSECLERGGNVTTAELEEAYFSMCQANGWQPRNNARQVIRETISQTFTINEQNSISRNGKDQKGYRGIQLKAEYRASVGQKGQLF